MARQYLAFSAENPVSYYLRFRKHAAARTVATMLLVVACFRIVSTYSQLSQTYDEPFHVLRGMHWNTGHEYVHSEHPPLGPAVFALLPSWLNFEYEDIPHRRAGNLILSQNGNYLQTLATFRSGNLPFLCICCYVLFRWAERRNGPWVATLAVGWLTICPIILAHSGLATTDMPITATLLLAIVSLQRAIQEVVLTPCTPAARKYQSLYVWSLAGLCGGLAAVSKFTALLFLPVVITAMLALAMATGSRIVHQRAACFLAVYALFAFLTIWAVYRFSFGTLGTIDVSSEYRFEGFSPAVEEWVVPAPEFVAGLIWAKGKVEVGHSNYFLGECDTGGSWLFFPVVLSVKTPLLMMLFAVFGSVRSLTRLGAKGCWQIAIPFFLVVAMMLSVMPSSVNLGVRHLLPLYPMLALLAAEGCLAAWGCWYQACKTPVWRSTAKISFTAIFIPVSVWVAFDSFRCHPNYLSYFNVLAGRHPEQIAIDSDLDWGQGLVQLSEVCRELDIDRLQLVYFGTADLDQFDLPQRIKPTDDGLGPRWIAISTLKLYCNPKFAWLQQLEPRRKIAGGAMQLFYTDSD